MSARGKPAVVLLSGGLDSATTLALAGEAGYSTHALTVSYGQRHGIETERAAAIAGACGAVHRVVELDLGFLRGSSLTDRDVPVPRHRGGEEIAQGIPTTYVPARNTVFLALALAWAESIGSIDLFVGVNAVDYSGYPDCRPEFIEAFEALARRATRAGVEGEPIRVHAPLLHWTKARIVREAVRLDVDLATTLSCYDPGPRGAPCEACDSCLLRARGFEEAGIADPAL